MKINRKLKNILTMAAGLTAVSLITVPAVTLTSCSAASNSYYPETTITFNSQDVLGLETPKEFYLNNATGTAIWNGNYYGFTSLDQIQSMYTSVLQANGLNVSQPNKAALENFEKQSGKSWYEATGLKPLVEDFSTVNRLPFAVLNALNIFQLAQSTTVNYAKTVQKALVNLGMNNYDDQNPFSLTNIFKNNSNLNEIKQVIYGLTQGIGSGANSYLLGMNNINLNITSDVSFDPNKSDSLTNPGMKIGAPGRFVSSTTNGDNTDYQINVDDLNSATMHYITITPTISYNWYKELQTSGKAVTTVEDLNKMQSNMTTSQAQVYDQLGSLKGFYEISLAPITVAVKQDVIFTGLNLNDKGTPVIDESCYKDIQAITTGAIAPVSFQIGESKNPIEVKYMLGAASEINNAKDFGIHSASSQMLMNIINTNNTNSYDNDLAWIGNLYKLPYYGYQQYQALLKNNQWNKNSIKDAQTFAVAANGCLTWFNNQINSQKDWLNLDQIPVDGNFAKKLLTGFKTAGIN